MNWMKSELFGISEQFISMYLKWIWAISANKLLVGAARMTSEKKPISYGGVTLLAVNMKGE